MKTCREALTAGLTTLEGEAEEGPLNPVQEPRYTSSHEALLSRGPETEKLGIPENWLQGRQ